ncbi:MAG: hypothetical protein Kow0010_17290 [Dehalococcoidia bacterium]
MTAGAIALATLAFWLPSRFPDANDAPGLATRMAETEARHMSDIPPLSLQVRNIAVDANGDLRHAHVTWRTVFGIPFGATEMTGRSVSSDLSVAVFALTWGGFILSELLLVSGAATFAFRCLDGF